MNTLSMLPYRQQLASLNRILPKMEYSNIEKFNTKLSITIWPICNHMMLFYLFFVCKSKPIFTKLRKSHLATIISGIHVSSILQQQCHNLTEPQQRIINKQIKRKQNSINKESKRVTVDLICVDSEIRRPRYGLWLLQNGEGNWGHRMLNTWQDRGCISKASSPPPSRRPSPPTPASRRRPNTRMNFPSLNQHATFH